MKHLSIFLLASATLFAPAVIVAEAEPSLQPAPLNTDPSGAFGDASRRFQGVPGLASAPGGRLWAVWYAGGRGEGPENYVVGVTSNDGGETWSAPRFVIDPPGEVRAYDPVPWIDPQGRLWIFYAQSYRWWDGRAGVWAIVAEDPGQPNPHWSAPRRLLDGIMMNKPTVLHNGDWLLPVSIWDREPEKDPANERFVPELYRRFSNEAIGAHVYRSQDRGATFSQLGTVKVPNPSFDEHAILERKDGSLRLLARNRNGIVESLSTDGGQTWTEAKSSAIPHIDSRFFIRRLHSGHLLLVKHNPPLDAAWLQQGKEGALPAIWRKRSHLTAYLSDDDGKTWNGGLLLDERPVVAYPDGDQDENGNIFIIYDRNRHTDKEILMARFTEADVLAKEFVTPGSRAKILVNKATGPDSRETSK